MDDVQRLKNFRTDEPGPSEPAREAARAALARAISTERAGSRLGRLRDRPRMRTMAFAAAAVAVAAAALIGVLGWGGSGSGPSPTGPQQILVSSTVAQKALRHLASSIAGHSLTVHPGQYLYSDFESEYPTYSGSCVTYQIEHSQWWRGADGSGLMRDTHGPQQFTSPADRARCLAADPTMQLQSGGTSDDWNAPDCLFITPQDPSLRWSDLSSDPHVLLQQIRKLVGGQPTAGQDFTNIGMFLRLTNTPHRVRVALYQAAALIPGIKLLGTVQDHDGRTGLGVSFPSQGPFVSGPHAPPPGQTSVMIFDRHTGELLGEQGTRPRFWAVYQPERVVDELPSTPPPLGPPCKPLGLGHFHRIPGGSITNGAPTTSP